MAELISFQDFLKVDIRVGTVIEAVFFDEAIKPAYKLKIDFGDIGILRSSAQITDYYKTEELVGKQITAVVNFPPKQIGKLMSQCLVLGAVEDSGRVVLLQPEREIKNGNKIG